MAADEHHAPSLGLFEVGFASWSRVLSVSINDDVRLSNFSNACREAVTYVGKGLDKPIAVDTLLELAETHGLVEQAGLENIEAMIGRAFEPPTFAEAPQPKVNGGAEPAPEREQQPQLRYATLYIPPNPMEIPRRGWLYGGHYIRQAATATVAPGGFGKTTLTIHEAIMMVAAGLAVWYLSGEDPKVEIDRRIAAHCLHHQVNLRTFTGRLFVDDKSTFPLTIATAPRTGAVKFNDQALTEFEHAILASEIDVVMLDPFIAFHTVAENDNGSIDAVTKRLAAIAQRTDSCLEISHHVRKPFMGQGTLTVDDARGGSALINAVRSGRVINRMTQAEAENAKISNEDRHFYIRVDRGKRNMAPPDKASWFHLVSKEIANGDSVQALEEWEFPKAAKPTEADIIWLRVVMFDRPLGFDRRSPDWIGDVLAEHFERDPDDEADLKWIRQTVAHLVKEKVIRKTKLRNKNSKERTHYVLCDAKPHLTVVPRDGEPPPADELPLDDNGDDDDEPDDDDPA
jgi:hypothetical protein